MRRWLLCLQAFHSQLNVFEQQPYDTQHALDVLFHGCAISPSCRAEYPHLDQIFYQTVANLNARPAIVQINTSFLRPDQNGVQELDGDAFVNIIFNAMYVSSAIPTLPKLILQVSEGNYNFLSEFASDITLEQSTDFYECLPGQYHGCLSATPCRKTRCKLHCFHARAGF
ncbi:MAG TPA: hypothetical protein VKV40_04405 [Ktedonobacteraceae bacterium]|nr:hypothetical protein [Ktedonobacteraceae bacterium]